jgi:hypothetical protein
VCQLETLRRTAQRNLRGILEKLPRTLDETYERVLEEVSEDNREHARRLPISGGRMAARESDIKESRRCAIWVVVENSVLRESV